MKRTCFWLAIGFWFIGICAGAARAQALAGSASPLLVGVGIDQKLGQQIPMDITFHDETGGTVRLDQLRTGRPIVVALVYFNCPSLCTVVLNDTLNALRVIPQHIGEQYDVWTISFDPKETSQLAAEKKDGYVKSYLRTRPEAAMAGSGWHFLTGDQVNISRFTQAVGFHYKWDLATQQYVHPAGILILTPEGKISRYFFGVDYDPTDLRLSLVEASGGKIGSFTDQLLLFCCRYDPSTGKYTLAITGALKIGGVLMLALLAAGMALLWRMDRQRTRLGLQLAATVTDEKSGEP